MTQPTDSSRLDVIIHLATRILDGHKSVTKDERHEPELRDIQHIAMGHKPRTNAGKEVWAEVHNE